MRLQKKTKQPHLCSQEQLYQLPLNDEVFQRKENPFGRCAFYLYALLQLVPGKPPLRDFLSH